MNTITTEDFKTKLSSGETLDVIDVRTPAEYRTVHVHVARLIPLDQVDAEAVRSSRPAQANGETYILCKSGSRSKKAAEKLAGADDLNPVVVEGGTDACVEAGCEVERGKSVISLERQVRIAAGSLVAIGVALSFVSPWFLIIPAFVGCGLIFAGVTDHCGMGMLLARLPWNR